MSLITDTATPALRQLVLTLRNPSEFHKSWAKKVARLAKRNARAKSKGGDFWTGIEGKTDVTSSSSSGAIVECRHFAGAHKHFGGVIKAKNVDALTVPISDESKGKSVDAFKKGGRKLFVAPGTSVLGYSVGSRFCGLFVLRKSVTQAPEPWWPSDDEVLAIGEKEADIWLKI